MAEVTLDVRSCYFLFPKLEEDQVPVEEVQTEENETTTEQEGEN